MQNAAIYLHPDGFDTTTGRLLGRHAAGESFLRGFMRHADVDELRFWNVYGANQAELDALIRNIGETDKPIRWIARQDRKTVGETGVLSIPGPEIGVESWRRRMVGSRSYAICGLTHTTATDLVMQAISHLLIDPTEDYDALICTSSAVRASVEVQLDGVREYLAAERGPRRRPEPQRVTIPLGVNTEDFRLDPEHRRAWRERLGIPEDAAVALFVGRFNIEEKMNPGLMAVALEKAVEVTGKPIYWVNSGWAESETGAEIYHREARALCPSVHYIHIDGRPADVRFSIWSVADFFISFSDNIQETFGLTPVEAMAAGLPCVVTDWNGYKDTVRHGEDGFRVPTIAPPPGAGGDLAYWFSNRWIRYKSYVAAAGQYTAIDYAAAVSAIATLVNNADFRRRLGENAKARARSVFDWAAIIPQYQALWADLDARRRAAPPEDPPREDPFRPDPYRLFGNYPTRHIDLEDRVAIAPGMTFESVLALLQTPLATYGGLNRPTPQEVRQILIWLAERGEGRVGDLLETFPLARRPYVWRGLLWIARLGPLIIQPSA